MNITKIANGWYSNDSWETPTMPRVLTVPEVAKELRLSPDTVKKLLNEGRLKGVRTGHYSGKWRVSETAIEAFLNGEAEKVSA